MQARRLVATREVHFPNCISGPCTAAGPEHGPPHPTWHLGRKVAYARGLGAVWGRVPGDWVLFER